MHLHWPNSMRQPSKPMLTTTHHQWILQLAPQLIPHNRLPRQDQNRHLDHHLQWQATNPRQGLNRHLEVSHHHQAILPRLVQHKLLLAILLDRHQQTSHHLKEAVNLEQAKLKLLWTVTKAHHLHHLDQHRHWARY
jgi:hypothetical protein